MSRCLFVFVGVMKFKIFGDCDVLDWFFVEIFIVFKFFSVCVCLLCLYLVVVCVLVVLNV